MTGEPTPAGARATRVARLLTSLGVVVVAGLLFGATRTDAIQVADSGELVAVACNLGVAHPPGYPLYTLVGHLFSQLPWSTPAGRLSLLSLVAGVWAAWSLHAIAWRLTASLWAASVAALALAVAPLFWRYASLPEVFALHVALCLATIHLALIALDVGSRRRGAVSAGACGLLFGLSMAHHHAAVFTGPVVLLALVAHGRGWRCSVERFAIAGICGLLGLLPYGYLMLADPTALPRWGETETLRGLWHHVLRRDYGTLTLAAGKDAPPAASLVAFVAQIPRQSSWVLWVASALGLSCWLGRAAGRWPGLVGGDVRASIVDRARDGALLLVLLLAGPGFLLMFNIPPSGIGLQIVERFFLLPTALLMIALAVGLSRIDRARWIASHRGRHLGYRALVWLVVGCGAFGAHGRADVSQSYAVEDFAVNALTTVRPHAMIVGEGDARRFSVEYAQHVLGLRPDVQYVDVRMLGYRWYVEQQRRRFPRFSYEFEPDEIDTLGLLRSALDDDVPVYLAAFYGKSPPFPAYPVGPLRLVAPPEIGIPPLPEVVSENERVFARFQRRGRDPDPDLDTWSATLRSQFAATWYAIAIELHRAGEVAGAERAAERGRRWAPWLGMPAWYEDGRRSR